MRKKIYTLAEVIVVVIILAILVSIAIPIYRKTSIKARDKEAQTMLRLIREAERIYRLKYYTYWACTDTDDCNADLKLDLPTEYWTYNVPNADRSTFCAQATASTGSWRIEQNQEDPVPGGCP